MESMADTVSMATVTSMGRVKKQVVKKSKKQKRADVICCLLKKADGIFYQYRYLPEDILNEQ